MSTQEKKTKKDSQDDHSGDEKGEMFNHDDVHSHYYAVRHLPDPHDHEYLAWSEPHIVSHGQVDPKLSATVGNLNLDWPIPESVHYYETTDEHAPVVEDIQQYAAHSPQTWYEDEHVGAVEHRVKQLYGDHYDSHDSQVIGLMVAPVVVGDEVIHSDHYLPHEVHHQLDWPGPSAPHYEGGYMEGLHRDAEIEDYHHELHFVPSTKRDAPEVEKTIAKKPEKTDKPADTKKEKPVVKAAKPTQLSQTQPAKTAKADKDTKKKTTSKESGEKKQANEANWMIDENDEDNYPVYPH